MFYLTFLRHGESLGNQLGLIQGHSDLPLSERGERQAQNLADYWHSQGVTFDLIITSPLARASKTAEIISARLGLSVEQDPVWKERSFGRLEGRVFDEVVKEDPAFDFFHPYISPGIDGESQVELYTRASLAVLNLIRRPAGKYLVVSHGAILNKAIFFILGITPQSHYNSPVFYFKNAGFISLRFNPDNRQWRILSFNPQTPQKDGNEGAALG